jgi:hypothetical protein
MPGPQESTDQSAGVYDGDQYAARHHDQPGHSDRPARGSLTELRQRLERLPAGHPSSPYNDDGSRKPPVTRLKDLELPLPGDERATGGRAEPDRAQTGPSDSDQPETAEVHTAQAATDQAQKAQAATDLSETAAPESRAASDEPRSLPDGTWEWKGRSLTPEECRIADKTLARCRTAEGRTDSGDYGDAGLTPAMRRIESQLENARLVPDTEKFALKSPDRFKEKLAGRIADEPWARAAELAAEIHDAVRYTYLCKDEHYSDGVRQVHGALEDQGFELELRRNSWDNEEYKGVNSRWRDPASSQTFEVQFHTDESWAAKQQTHVAYELIASATTPANEKELLRDYQREVSASVRIPPGALDIFDYRKDG